MADSKSNYSETSEFYVNEIVSQFAPESNGKMHGVKCEFRGEKYIVKADLASGYLRIYSKKEKKYVKLDGTPSIDDDETHFKILKREEM